ncbi:MAG: MerR family transcriptional regulator [Anaerolineae bacterium]|nr:MerR family transcriptional regulator [Anaerolineae bacterium]
MYTVKQLAEMAGITVRTLHYYDEIGLLSPSRTPSNGYRRYGEAEVLRLQQIMLFRELEFSLSDIQALLDDPAFDLLHALRAHRAALQARAARLQRLTHTIDQTIKYLQGETTMSQPSLFDGFSDEQQAEYEEEARAMWDPALVDDSVRRWNSYTDEEKAEIGARGNAIFAAIRDNMHKGADSAEVQAQIAALQAHFGVFYTCTDEILMGLGEAYHTHPGFIETFQKIHPDLPEFLYEAISHYCISRLED